MHPAIKINKFYPFKKIRTVELPGAKDAKIFLFCLDRINWIVWIFVALSASPDLRDRLLKLAESNQPPALHPFDSGEASRSAEGIHFLISLYLF
jgi:hypothetical protein